MKIKNTICKLGYWAITVFHWICTIVGAFVIVGLLMIFCRSCYHKHKPESILYVEWEKVDSEDGYNGHVLTFDWNGEYSNSVYNAEGVTWNYEFFEPDSLILYHHGFYEERYKILNLTKDTLMMRQSEYIFHAAENGKEIEAQYGDGLMPIYTYIRKRP